MKLFKYSKDLSAYLSSKKASIGFVPTMGALHRGHTSLIEISRKENDITVCSIFVNPTQFNDPKDLEKYPRPIEKDIDLLLKSGCDVLYHPDVNDVYPNGTTHPQNFDLASLDTILEGASRPGHFQGVANVVNRLFDIVQPTRAYFGQKDFQQVMVIRKMVEVSESKVEIKTCPIVREESGLAMSSRNVRLNEKLRVEAGKIYEALLYIKANYDGREIGDLKKGASDIINKIEGSRIDYIKICDTATLTEITSRNEKEAVCLLAVIVGGVRLIDNILLSPIPNP